MTDMRAAHGATIPHGSSSELPALDKVVVAIHGIGSQRRSETIRSVARRFGDGHTPLIPIMPLGFFNVGKAGEVHVSRLLVDADDPLARIGFAEVFWADIPRKVVIDDDTLEETKAWGRSVVSRAQAVYSRHVPNGVLTPDDFALGTGVVEEIVETIGVLENLCFLADKAGLFKFELGPLLRDYVGDVQLVSDFERYRSQIVHRFHDAMAQIAARFSEHPATMPEIYIVAHSEGTVVSFLGLLQALSSPSVVDAESGDAIPTDWVSHVAGFMTIGSPIDKHLALWPELWRDLHLASQVDAAGHVKLVRAEGDAPLELRRPIKWRNYYDFGDPIGFELDSAVSFLKQRECQAFEFDRQHNFGFSRYWLPGKAHNDYWGDSAVFGHFISDVVFEAKEAAPPANRFAVGVVSSAIPYLISAALHLAAVFVLFKAIAAFPTGSATGPRASDEIAVALLGLLLLSVTVAARIPRLVKRAGLRWHALSFAAFATGASLCALFLPAAMNEAARPPLPADATQLWPEVALLLLMAAATSCVGWFAPRRPSVARRSMVAFGALMVASLVAVRLHLSDHPPVWPLLLAGAGFLYLWWLGILLFDLSFIWHRYIRYSVAVNTLADWLEGNDAAPRGFRSLLRRRGGKPAQRHKRPRDHGTEPHGHQPAA